MTSDLTVADVKLMMNIIDVASQKGVFSGEVLPLVGLLYQKLKNVAESQGQTDVSSTLTKEK